MTKFIDVIQDYEHFNSWYKEDACQRWSCYFKIQQQSKTREAHVMRKYAFCIYCENSAHTQS